MRADMGVSLTCMRHANERLWILELEYRHFFYGFSYWVFSMFLWCGIFCFALDGLFLIVPFSLTFQAILAIALAFSILQLLVQRRSNMYMYHFYSLCFDPCEPTTFCERSHLITHHQHQWCISCYRVISQMLMQIYSWDYECTWSRFFQTRAVSTNLDSYGSYYCYMYVNSVKKYN